MIIRIVLIMIEIKKSPMYKKNGNNINNKTVIMVMIIIMIVVVVSLIVRWYIWKQNCMLHCISRQCAHIYIL